MTLSDNVLVDAGSGSQIVVNRVIIVNTSYSLIVTILSKPNLEAATKWYNSSSAKLNWNSTISVDTDCDIT